MSLAQVISGLGVQDVATGCSCRPEGLRMPTLSLVPPSATPGLRGLVALLRQEDTGTASQLSCS